MKAVLSEDHGVTATSPLDGITSLKTSLILPIQLLLITVVGVLFLSPVYLLYITTCSIFQIHLRIRSSNVIYFAPLFLIVTSNRYTEPRPLFANNTNGLSKDGFDVEFTMNFNDKNDPKDGDVTTLDRFEAPGALRLFTKVGDDGSCHIGETYTSPAKPGWSNVMIRQTVVKTKDGKVPVTGRQTRDGQIKVSLMIITTKSLLQILKFVCTNH